MARVTEPRVTRPGLADPNRDELVDTLKDDSGPMDDAGVVVGVHDTRPVEEVEYDAIGAVNDECVAVVTESIHEVNSETISPIIDTHKSQIFVHDHTPIIVVEDISCAIIEDGDDSSPKSDSQPASIYTPVDDLQDDIVIITQNSTSTMEPESALVVETQIEPVISNADHTQSEPIEISEVSSEGGFFVKWHNILFKFG